MRRLMTVGAFAVAMVTLSAHTVSAAAETIFDYIPSPLPDNVVSYSYESFGVAEAGDQISFSTNGNQTLDNAKVMVSSWACENGTGWAATNTVPCVTTPGVRSRALGLGSWDHAGALGASGPRAAWGAARLRLRAHLRI